MGKREMAAVVGTDRRRGKGEKASELKAGWWLCAFFF